MLELVPAEGVDPDEFADAGPLRRRLRQRELDAGRDPGELPRAVLDGCGPGAVLVTVALERGRPRRGLARARCPRAVRPRPTTERASRDAHDGRGSSLSAPPLRRSPSCSRATARRGPTPLGLVVLAEQLRPETHETIEFFRSARVDLKILSGDRPETVAAIARDVGIPGGAACGRRGLENPAELRRAVLASPVVAASAAGSGT